MVVAAVLVAMAYIGAAMCLNQLVLQVSFSTRMVAAVVFVAMVYSGAAKCQNQLVLQVSLPTRMVVVFEVMVYSGALLSV